MKYEDLEICQVIARFPLVVYNCYSVHGRKHDYKTMAA
jgi:hypothetical protein